MILQGFSAGRKTAKMSFRVVAVYETDFCRHIRKQSLMIFRARAREP
jgi:hypothetical protein